MWFIVLLYRIDATSFNESVSDWYILNLVYFLHYSAILMENVSRGIFFAMENTIVKVMSFLFYNKKIQKSYRPT